MALFNQKNKNTEETGAGTQTAGEQTAAPQPFRPRPAAPFRPAVFLRELVNLISLNLIFLVTCIPVITIPAAVTAMNRITGTIVQDQNYFLWPDYWKTFRQKFGRALQGGLVFGLVTLLFVVAGVVYYLMFGKSLLFILILAVVVCFLIVIYMTSTYYWTTLAFTDLPFSVLLKRSLSMVFGCWKKTLKAFVFVIMHLIFAIGLAPIGLGTTTVLTDIWIFGFFLILFSLNSLLINYSIWPAIYENVTAVSESAQEVQTAAKTDAGVPENGLQSASINNLTWEDEQK